ncbi:MAG TPA: PA domain-containing protein [Rudaea sp.]|nr:PA domain-containing protein [Rudaea sp.]
MTGKSVGICTLVVAIACAFGSTRTHASATFVINNNDGPGVGFNDTSMPNANAGCQSGETLGQCRLRVFTTAANQWGQLLNSPVTITVDASMDSLECDQTSAVLGSAGPNTVHANFTNAPRANTAYVQAEANSLSGSDRSGSSDINATFNVDIDTGTCLTGADGWWYDTDPEVPIASGRIPLLPVVFHELGHGLGFISLYADDGTSLAGTSTPIWGYYLYDTSTNKLWKNMTKAQRAASTTNDPNLVWTGPHTSKQSTKFLGHAIAVVVNSPAGIAGPNAAQEAQFGPSVVSSPVTADVVLADDGTGTTSDACEPITNASAIKGKIALVDRGTCNFTVKVKNAQDANAVGVIVANNVATGLPGMGGSDPTITIPSLGVAQALGTTIKANLPGVNATLGLDPSGLAGTNSGCVRMYAPNPLESGSSVSHFSSAAFPNLLMEPALNESIFNKVDLTLPLFQDIGWNTSPEDILFIDGFDPSPCAFVQP